MFSDNDRTVVSGAPGVDATVRIGAVDADQTQMAVAAECPVCHTSNAPGETYCGDCGFLLSSTPEGLVEPAITPPAQLVAADGREFALNPGRNTIGRVNADILLPDPSVSRSHAAITLEGGACRIEDLGSTNGTLVNGRRLPPHEPCVLASGDEVAFGGMTLRLVLPPGFETSQEAPAVETDVAPAVSTPASLIAEETGVEYPIAVGTTTIGRRSANMLAFPGDPYLSGRHAEITFDGATLTFVDVGSTNGSFVNGERVGPHEPQTLRDGDVLVLGQQRLRVRLELPAEVPTEEGEPVAPAEAPAEEAAEAPEAGE